MSDISQQMAVMLGIVGGDKYAPEVPQPPPFQYETADTGASVDRLQQSALNDADAQAAQAAAKTQTQPQAGVAPKPPGVSGGDWRVDVLNRIGAPVTDSNLRALTAWQKAEGGGGVAGGPTPSNYNWLNTTRDMPGSTSINSVGVKSYANYEDGINATVGALTNGLYGNVLGALHAGNDPMAVATAIANSPWGTGMGVEHILMGGGGGVTIQ